MNILNGSVSGAFKLIQDSLGVVISLRGDKVIIDGTDDEKVKMAEKLVHDIYDLKREGPHLKTNDIIEAVMNLNANGSSLKDMIIPVPSKIKYVIPKTETQRKYVEAIKHNDIVVGIGPAGTGKTYLAVAMAVTAYMKKEVSRIILARPAVEAGERLGFLPGDIHEKINPYLRPLYDALFDMMDADRVSLLVERGVLEIAPLAYMRGRTLRDAFVILDEAQNTTSEQMKMYLTRLGPESRTVITGDVTQVDLPHERVSGLVEIETVLRGIDGIKFVYFSEKDVVRHRLVKEIIKAYEKHENH
ncbi:PhoH family protein [Candidatus Magnetomonas plexicatena]|uniref:PhoH family protein n=1 Tax=Candidatus Magnetomonas plexicatena TaxID=2552947 RepID=UPI0011000656|nr:PhoH family protein [Nitrospirales bacterium LBB_01]